MKGIIGIFRKELIAHILSFRFAFMILVCQILIPLSIYMGIMKYKERLENYNTDRARFVESLTEAIRVLHSFHNTCPESGILDAWRVQRKPEPLSFLAEGCETELGHFVRVNHRHVPYTATWRSESEFELWGTPVDVFVKDFQSFDLALVLQIVLSLFAILLVHDSISGEKEAGTLKLLASQGISRGAILMGKYMGAMAALVIPFTIAILLGMIYIPLEIGKEIGSDEILRLLLLYIASILYLSVFTILGILISSATRRSSTSLIFGLFAWVFLVVIWPNIIGFVAESMYNKIPYDEDSIRKKIELIRKDYSRDIEAVKARYPFLKDIPFSFDGYDPEKPSAELWDPFSPDRIHVINQLRPVAREIELLGMKHSERIWEVRKEYLEKYPYRYIKLALALNKISPAGAYYNLTSIIARTDWGSYLHFLDEVREYRNVLQRWVMDDSISSTRWFTDTDGITRIPVFKQGEERVVDGLLRAGPDFLILFLANILCFIIAYVRFALYDVR